MSRAAQIAELAGSNPMDSIPATMTGAEMAVLLGLSVRYLNNLAANGVLEASGRNRFPTRACITSYCNYLKSRRSSDSLSDEKLRLATAQAEKIELQNAQKRLELLPADDVRREWINTATDLRAALLAVPGRIASRLGLDRAVQAGIDAELREALTGLSYSVSDGAAK